MPGRKKTGSKNWLRSHLLRERGMTFKQIAKELGVSRQRAEEIFRNGPPGEKA